MTTSRKEPGSFPVPLYRLRLDYDAKSRLSDHWQYPELKGVGMRCIVLPCKRHWPFSSLHANGHRHPNSAGPGRHWLLHGRSQRLLSTLPVTRRRTARNSSRCAAPSAICSAGFLPPAASGRHGPYSVYIERSGDACSPGQMGDSLARSAAWHRLSFGVRSACA